MRHLQDDSSVIMLVAAERQKKHINPSAIRRDEGKRYVCTELQVCEKWLQL